MNKIFCHSFVEIIQNYIRHLKLSTSPKHRLISNDIPDDKCIGFSCCDDHYLMKIGDLLNNAHRVRDQKWSSLLTRDRIISGSGRRELADIFNRCIKTSLKDLNTYLK